MPEQILTRILALALLSASFGACSQDESLSLERAVVETRSSIDGDGDGYTVAQGDCDDDPGVCSANCSPGHLEICDGYDNDCDSSTDEGFFDNDSDGNADCVDADDDDDGIVDATDPCPFISGTTGCTGDADHDGTDDGSESLYGHERGRRSRPMRNTDVSS